MALAKETILEILQDPSLKARKRGIVIKMICPHAATTTRNYMIALLTTNSTLFGGILVPEFAVNLVGDASHIIGISVDSYIVKPTLKDYLELWEMYRKYKNGNDNKSNKE